MQYTKKGHSKFEKRYAENWRSISYKTKLITGWRCCSPECRRKCEETHHALYRDKDGAIAGREIPGIHIFPLCLQCHEKAHHPDNWKIDRRNPELGNKNTVSYWKTLRVGWEKKRIANVEKRLHL